MCKKRISVKSAKAKGRKLQNLTAKKISELLDIPYGKDTLIFPRPMGQSGTDVGLIGESLERFQYAIECKNAERWNFPMWIEQAKSNQSEETDWLLVVGKNNYKPIVVMDMNAFFDLCEKAKL